MAPQCPVYVISKGRAATCLTARFLAQDGVPFYLVVEPQEAPAYRAAYPEATLLVLPFQDLGLGSIPARNWVWNDAVDRGATAHWILDDNITCIQRRQAGFRIRCPAGPALRACEDFTARYDVPLSGLNYSMFAPKGDNYVPPFRVNVHVYSGLLIRHDLPFRWRGRYNEDTDLCLQALTAGHNIIQFNAFLLRKVATGRMGGGNADELYQGDGRTHMARALARQWPGVVKVKKRFGRAQHVVSWGRFKRKLVPAASPPIPAADPEYDMELKAYQPITNPLLQALLA
jgi:hypothetical protein